MTRQKRARGDFGLRGADHMRIRGLSMRSIWGPSGGLRGISEVQACHRHGHFWGRRTGTTAPSSMRPWIRKTRLFWMNLSLPSLKTSIAPGFVRRDVDALGSNLRVRDARRPGRLPRVRIIFRGRSAQTSHNPIGARVDSGVRYRSLLVNHLGYSPKYCGNNQNSDPLARHYDWSESTDNGEAWC